MFNFYLFNKSYEKASIVQIEENLRVLNDLAIAERAKEDYFWKSESLWYCNTADGSFYDVVFSKIPDKQLRDLVLPRLFQAITSVQEEFLSLEEFDQCYRIYNAFYGVVFDSPTSERYIINKETYSAFRKKCLWNITPKTLWERKEKLFSKLIFCPDVENNLDDIGSQYFSQIVSRLTALDRYAEKEWIDGKFDYRKANRLSPLNISPESESTMQQKKYYNERVFKMPDGTTRCFELHIKTGDLRFHFYPENGKIFIGYIGMHLSTVKYD
jgi:hypothetical protein